MTGIIENNRSTEGLEITVADLLVDKINMLGDLGNKELDLCIELQEENQTKSVIGLEKLLSKLSAETEKLYATARSELLDIIEGAESDMIGNVLCNLRYNNSFITKGVS